MELVEFSLRGVRCFAKRQNFRIRPLTFLVGENSTGKTTALGCFQVLASCLSNGKLLADGGMFVGGDVDFNREPYEMGNFKNLISASAEGGTFELSFTVKGEKETIERIIEFTKNDSSVEPVIKRAITKFQDGEVILEVGGEKGKAHDKTTNTFRIRFENKQGEPPPHHLLGFFPHILFRPSSHEHIEKPAPLKKYIDRKCKELGWGWLDISSPQVYSTAPVRSRPKRTYDPIRQAYDPEGSDVPTRLMRMQATNKKAWQKLLKLLEKFGKESQMFDSLEIKNFETIDPFQLLVNVDGTKVSIIDVGYGVSQVLPLLFRVFEPVVHSSRRKHGTATFLFQQPEVHLHPKAQAALASMLVELTEQKGRGFIVETHSRNMIDRVRIEIMRGNISPDNVSLIYLQPERSSSGRVVKAHNITFDGEANMIGEPPHYAEFLMEETGRMFGFKD